MRKYIVLMLIFSISKGWGRKLFPKAYRWLSLLEINNKNIIIKNIKNGFIY